MRTATIILNDQECELCELKARPTSVWLKKVEEKLLPPLQTVLSAGDIDVKDLQSLETLLPKLTGILTGSLDILIELLVEYAPYLKEEIEEAYTSEILLAVAEVVKLAIPFEGLEAKIAPLIKGISQLQETSQS